MKNPTKILAWLALVLGSIALLLTPEYSAAFPPAANPTPARTPAARKPNDGAFTLFLPIIYKPPGPIYLPLVARAPSPTPTFTLTPTPIANPIQNWNFESGHTAWYEDPVNGIITNDLAGKPAHSGSWAAWLGGEIAPWGSTIQHYLSQYVAIPAGAKTLSFWYWIDSLEWCGFYDGAFLYVDGNRLVDFDLCQSNNTNGWRQWTLGIATYAGRSVWIQFVARLDDATNSNFLVDDVVISSNSSAPFAAHTPTPKR